MKKINSRINDRSEKFILDYFSNIGAGTEYLLAALPDILRTELATARSQFTPEELLGMIDVSNGLILSPQIAGQHMAIEIEDGSRLDGLDEKWGFDRETCVQKIIALTPTQRMMLELWAAGYWLDSDRDVREYAAK